MTPLANIQIAMPVLFFPSLFCFLMQLLKRCETFSLKKKSYARVSSAYDRFFPNSRLRVTLRRQISIKGGGSAVTAIITQFYFYFAHLKST